jgi:hypothetical protein
VVTEDLMVWVRQSRRPVAVQELMIEFLDAIDAATSDVRFVRGDPNWRAIELQRNGREIARVFTVRGIIQISNLLPGADAGTYEGLELTPKGVWRKQLKKGDDLNEILRCAADVLASFEGRRHLPPGSARAAGSGARTDARRGAGGGVTSSVRFAVLFRDDFTCRYCGRSAPEVVLHVDHRLPRSRGGTDDLDNLVTSCADCNLGKGARFDT